MQANESPVSVKNWVLFILFSMAVVFGWQVIFPPPEPPPRGPAPVESPAAEDPALPASSPALPVIGAGPGSLVEPALAATGVRRRVVRNAQAIVELTNVGGRVTSWKLPGHPGYHGPDELVDLVLTRPEESAASSSAEGAPPRRPVRDDEALLPLQVVTGDPGLDLRLAEALHVIKVETEDGRARVTMSWADGAGTSVRKILRFRDDLPLVSIEARLVVEGRPRSFRLAWGPGLGDHSPAQRDNMYFQRGKFVWRAGDIERVDRPDQAEALPASAVDWAGLEDSYFLALFIPGTPDSAGSSSPSGGFAPRSGFRAAGRLPPQANGKAGKKKDWPEQLVLEAPFSPEAPVQTLFVGERDRELLAAVDAEFGGRLALAKLPDLGRIIGPIAIVMHDVLVWLHGLLGNWGLAIIFLTLAIRTVLFPLTHFSMKKMRVMQDRMKAIKPRIDTIKAKYRKLPRDMDTRQREQAETMELYRSAGINPADQILGCLPMLLSLPFFWALFRLLQGAAEFRHQGFLLWTDLSSADPSHVWPFLTGITTFASQKLAMSRSTGGPSEMESVQRNMLFLFPVMFVVFCWSAPLGLVLYWTANNFIQMGQQYLLHRTLPPVEELSSRKPAKTDSAKNKKQEVKSAGQSEPKTREAVGEPTAANERPGRRRKRRRR